MSLTHNQFDVLLALLDSPDGLTQRDLADRTELALGTVNSVVRELVALGYIADRKITSSGKEELEPYRVRNAVIMAAGFSSRFAPVSYERPKGTLEVRGEVLIERQIRQLQEVGISDITVVVGYMKEAFFYLEDKFGIKTVVNEDYAVRNNHSSLALVVESLGNTYICSSDNYFVTNPFDAYVYRSFYSAEFVEGETDEYCIVASPSGRITDVTVGGRDSLVMIGHAYFDRAFATRFKEILSDVYDDPETSGKLWEDIYIDHMDSLSMVVREYPSGVLFEFDSVRDLAEFDQDFIVNVDSSIFDNICGVLGCERAQIGGIVPIKEGLTNLSFRFDVTGGNTERTYVYRHPGAGTDEIINRAAEARSQEIAKELGIDTTFVYEDPKIGWKISTYVENCIPFDYHNADHVARAMELARRLHASGASSEWSFDIFEKASEIVGFLRSRRYPEFPDFAEMNQVARSLAELVASDEVEPVLCHNDFYAPNFLVAGDRMELIDWEYSAMADYASDLGTFICCSDYTLEQAQDVINMYFEREASPEELRHSLAFVGLSSYYWFVWALYKTATGDPVGEWLYLWYRAARTYGAAALKLYGQAANDGSTDSLLNSTQNG
ncbi:phosphotransferase [Actinomyces minihominis]|uniref:phosphotransferase n=1 Tax=Actinomyces minihominis TaxID=2002838 RepID=UPI000C081C61|nr:phosphotransferase [Actinomyces minihominis]